MRVNSALLILLVFGAVACSSGDKKNESDEAPETALEASSDSDEMLDDEFAEEMDSEDELSDDEDLFAEEESNDREMSSSGPVIEMSGDSGMYTVEKGDTLMLIAFKIYGDYSMWRSLINSNPGLSGDNLRAGSQISFDAPSSKFEWNPQGNPHLIRSGETLGTISNDKYGTTKKWRSIYQNNQPMIKDPNLIFAGFTLYYIPDDRDLASEI